MTDYSSGDAPASKPSIVLTLLGVAFVLGILITVVVIGGIAAYRLIIEQDEHPQVSLQAEGFAQQTDDEARGDAPVAPEPREPPVRSSAEEEAGPEAAGPFFSDGLRLLSEGSVEEAHAIFEEVLRIRPDFSPAKDYLSKTTRMLEEQENGDEDAPMEDTQLADSARVMLGHPQIRGALDSSLITRMAQRNEAQIKRCYQEGLKRNPDAKGWISVRITIGAGGSVINGSVLENTTGSEEIGECIASRARSWRFPPPVDGGLVQVTYPFELALLY